MIKQTQREPAQITDKIFDNAGAAQYLDISPGTLDVWRSTGRYKIPFIKVGRLVKYRQSALDAFLESRTHGAEA